jgi:hypothetical protein
MTFDMAGDRYKQWGSPARLAVSAVFFAAACVAWLSGGTTGQAVTATQTQGISAAVASTISWGSGGGCTQNMPTAAFGALPAGGSNTLTGFTGCVTSNRRWSVDARMSTPLTSDDDGSTIDGSAIRIANTAVPTGSTNNCASASPCALSASPTTDVTLLTGARRSAHQFDYSLTLSVPSSATGGTYSDGVLTFTASN